MGMVGLPTLALDLASGTEPNFPWGRCRHIHQMNSFKVFKSDLDSFEDTSTNETTSRIVWESNPSVTFTN
jgi:hypothetical protein